jgi:hypothetical protein
LAADAPADTDTDTTASVLNRTGLFLHNQGQLTRAISHLRRALKARVRVLGEDHPMTRTVRSNLAHAVAERGGGETGQL